MRRLIFASVLILSLISTPAIAGDGFWPKTLSGEKGEVVLYQPQLEGLVGERLQARAAVMVHETGQEAPVFGAMWFEARLATDMDTRMASLESVEVTAARFPDVEESKVEALGRYLEQEIPTWDITFSIDRLVADLAAEVGSVSADSGFHNAPPEIYVRDHPSVLVIVDGDPIFQALDGPPLEYVVNTPFFMVREPGAGQIFLRGAGMWFTSPAIAGPWTLAAELPEAVARITPQLEGEEKEQATEAAADAEAMGLESQSASDPPEIIVSTTPAELVVTDGAPDLAPVQGTQLLYVTNSESDVVMDIASQGYFVLLAGRWYRSASLQEGPWEFVEPDELPADFANIPADSDLATVLASVPGTQEAREAVLDTQIPQTAEIDRKTATVTVTYDGNPEFDSCTDGVAHARNADKTVLLVDGTYYCCDTAVWFVSPGPDGPWRVATEVPDVIGDLPPECPAYNVKYVYIYDSTPEVVYVGYTPGYYNSYVYGGCVIYGTGWHYRPWYGHYYYPRPVTYGFGVHYSPWTGWGFSYGVSYGWLTIGVSWGRPPYYGWGPGGYRYGYRSGYMRGYHNGYRHGYGRGVAAGYRAGYRTAQNHGRDNLYRDRRDGVRRTGDLGDRPEGRQPRVSDRRNDVYADRDGNVYRDRGDGLWDRREQGEWKRDGERPESRDRPASGERPQPRDRPSTREQPQTRERPAQPPDRQRDVQPDRSRDRVQPNVQPNRGGADRRQELNRDRSSRNRGMERQRQVQPRPQPRGGGGRRG